MKTKEEIDELYHKLYSISIDGEDNLHYYSFVEGYIQCQKDIVKELEKETLDELFEAHEPEDFINKNDKNWWEKYKQD
jgi:hypothetical protein